ncbi:MAG: hypothetical protein ACKOQZ_00095, partial [Actinomycetota bacterium]
TTVPTTTTVVATTVPATIPAASPSVARPSSRSGRVLPQPAGTNRVLNPILGSPIPTQAVSVATRPVTTKVAGSNVVLSTKAPAQSTVHVYRDGSLVASVPAAAAGAIKVANSEDGTRSFQIVIVDKAGKMTMTPKKTVKVKKASTKGQ